MRLVLVGNIGLANVEGSKEEVLNGVHGKIFDTIAKANNEVGQITELDLQETGNGDFEFPPYFQKAAARSTHVTTGEQGRGRRGVASFSIDSDVFEVPPIDNHNEIVGIIINDFRKGRRVKTGKINLYRNAHKDYNRSTSETITAIRKMIKRMTTDYNVRRIAVVGDWNEEANVFLGSNFRELTHPELKHKHNNNTRETRIDRVFVNFSDARIVKVYPTFENKKTGDIENLGHKAYLVRIGDKENKEKKETVKIISAKKLKMIMKDNEPEFEINLKEDTERKEELIEQAAVEFTRKIEKLVDQAKVTVTKTKRKDHILISQCTAGQDEIRHGKKADKVFFRLGDTLTRGLTDEVSTNAPPIKDLHKKLEKKLNALNETDIELGEKVIKDLYGGANKVNGARCKTLDDFKKVVLSTSKSGALDYLGLNLKTTRIILGSNRRYLRRFKEITDGCMEVGHFPEIWKEDNIHFIYKNKGDRLDASNWRPITIAPSLGKHLEKVIGHFIAPIDDRNPDNFAYKKRRSCLSAITRVNQILSKARRKYKNCKKYKYVSFLSLDDISGAFESIDHILVVKVLETLLEIKEVQIGKLVGSYFKRNAFVREKEEKMELKGKFSTKTSPQGSLLSPSFWRIYDALFTKLYRNDLEKMVDTFEDIMEVDHVSYADDHLTVVIVRIKIEDEEKTADKISVYLMMVRNMLADATSQMGSAINPSKSENVVVKGLEEDIENILCLEGNNSPDKPTSATFKWLGYFLTLKEGHKLVFDVPKIEAKIKSICYMRDRIYQYTSNTEFRLKIYKVYIAPYVELYLPLVIQTKINMITAVHDLQHRTLCRAVNVPQTVNRVRLQNKLCERDVENKAKRMAERMIRELDLEKPTETSMRMGTRAREGGNAPITAADRSDYLDRIFIYSERTDLEELKKSKINYNSLSKWAKDTREAINRKIAQQRVGR